jgi:hypothetical protein
MSVEILQFCLMLGIWRKVIGMNAVQTGIESVPKDGDRPKDSFSLNDFVPMGTFGGSQDFILRIRNGSPIIANTGDQGGGQN